MNTSPPPNPVTAAIPVPHSTPTHLESGVQPEDFGNISPMQTDIESQPDDTMLTTPSKPSTSAGTVSIRKSPPVPTHLQPTTQDAPTAPATRENRRAISHCTDKKENLGLDGKSLWQAYHSRGFLGNHCDKYLKPDVYKAICGSDVDKTKELSKTNIVINNSLAEEYQGLCSR